MRQINSLPAMIVSLSTKRIIGLKIIPSKFFLSQSKKSETILHEDIKYQAQRDRQEREINIVHIYSMVRVTDRRRGETDWQSDKDRRT